MGGYIDGAQHAGGFWYETPEGSYPILDGETAWDTNVALLRQQMETGVPRLGFANLRINETLAAEAENAAEGLPRPTPARVKEILCFQENAARYGDPQAGDAFVRIH